MDAEKKKRQQGGARLQESGRAVQEKPAHQTSSRTKRPRRPKPRRTRKQKLLLALYITVTVIAALIVALFIAWSILSAPPDVESLSTRKPQITTTVDEDGEEVVIEIPGLSANRKEQFYTFLVTGISGGNTDTMMLGAYDVPNQQLHVMSLPRDTYVKWKGSTVLLNSIFSRAGGEAAGIQALEEAVGELTGVTPDFYVMLEWEAVGELVQAIGGVWFDVPFDMYCNDLSQGFKIDLKAGYQLLDGDKAMQLVRYRINSVGDTGRIDYSYGYVDGDLGRIETQQEFLKAVIAKCLQPEVLLSNLTEYIRIFQENVQTDLTVSNLAYFARSAVGGLNMDDVEFMTLPYKSAGDGHLLPSASEIVKQINEGFNPYEEDIQLSELNVVTTPPVSSSSVKEEPSKEEPVSSDDPDPDGTEDPTASGEPGSSDTTDDPVTTGGPQPSDTTGGPLTGDDPANSGTTDDPEPSETTNEPAELPSVSDNSDQIDIPPPPVDTAE